MEKFSLNGSTYIAGLVANNDGTNVNIFNSFNVVDIPNGTGIAGNSKGTISNCYNTGNCMYGLLGANQGKLKSCYSIGISFSKYILTYNIYANSYVSNCYYLEGTANSFAYSGDVSKVDSKTTFFSEGKMKQKDFVDLLNSENEEQDQAIWKVDKDNKNGGYPILYWQ